MPKDMEIVWMEPGAGLELSAAGVSGGRGQAELTAGPALLLAASTHFWHGQVIVPVCSLTKALAALVRCRFKKFGASDMKIGFASGASSTAATLGEESAKLFKLKPVVPFAFPAPVVEPAVGDAPSAVGDAPSPSASAPIPDTSMQS